MNNISKNDISKATFHPNTSDYCNNSRRTISRQSYNVAVNYTYLFTVNADNEYFSLKYMWNMFWMVILFNNHAKQIHIKLMFFIYYFRLIHRICDIYNKCLLRYSVKHWFRRLVSHYLRQKWGVKPPLYCSISLLSFPY